MCIVGSVEQELTSLLSKIAVNKECFQVVESLKCTSVCLIRQNEILVYSVVEHIATNMHTISRSFISWSSRRRNSFLHRIYSVLLTITKLTLLLEVGYINGELDSYAYTIYIIMVNFQSSHTSIQDSSRNQFHFRARHIYSEGYINDSKKESTYLSSLLKQNSSHARQKP